jgi:hypothetical protein
MSRKRTTARAGLMIITGTLSTACLGTGAALAQELPTPLPTQSLPPLPLPTSSAPAPSSSPSPDPSGGLPVPLPTGDAPGLPGGGAGDPPGTDPGTGTPTAPGSESGDGTTPPAKSKRTTRHASTSADMSRAGGFGYAAPPAFGALKVGSYFDSGVPGLGLPSVATWAPAAQGPGYAPLTAGEQTPVVASQLDPAAWTTPDPLSQPRNIMLAVAFTLVAGVATAHFKVAQLAEQQPGRHRTTG